MTKYWLLPDDIIELLPNAAEHVEHLRRRLLDRLSRWGYRLVMPPVAEFLDSLLAGSGEDLNHQTAKITDHKSGRLMGIRADITPQIARIDAHRLPTEGESRYAYCGEVLRNRSESTEPRRNPLILGAELFGVAGVSGDLEILALLLELFALLPLSDSVLELGHAGIFRGLAARYALDEQQQRRLLTILTGKKRAELGAWTAPEALREDVRILIEASIGDDPLAVIRPRFAGQHPEFDRALSDLHEAQTTVRAWFPEQMAVVDATQVGSYGYHSGLVFSAYAQGHYGAIARGGRYDGIGKAYGRARPATGLSVDLLTLSQLLEAETRPCPREEIIFPQEHAHFQVATQRRSRGEQIVFQHKIEE